ncbi:MAG: FkbM family methyltransferase [Pseudomonadota bacterium]
MSDAASLELEKLKRRHDRNMRVAHAHGLLDGIASMLRPGDIAVDCGANVGEVTGVLAATGAHVHCFEPDPFAFGKLSKRFGGAENVTLHQAAVGLSAGQITLMRAANFDDNPRGGSVKSTVIAGGRGIDEGEAAGIAVDLVNFPAFLRGLIDAHGEIAFLKMDIEGAELDILEEMERQCLFDPIRLTVAETHERKFKALRPRFRALKERVGAAFPPTKVNLDWI